MDIKARIDGLTEQKAKAALLWIINDTTINCCLCPHVYYCVKKPVIEGTDKCKNFRLDDALKEARK